MANDQPAQSTAGSGLRFYQNPAAQRAADEPVVIPGSKTGHGAVVILGSKTGHGAVVIPGSKTGHGERNTVDEAADAGGEVG